MKKAAPGFCPGLQLNHLSCRVLQVTGACGLPPTFLTGTCSDRSKVRLRKPGAEYVPLCQSGAVCADQRPTMRLRTTARSALQPFGSAKPAVVGRHLHQPLCCFRIRRFGGKFVFICAVLYCLSTWQMGRKEINAQKTKHVKCCRNRHQNY